MLIPGTEAINIQDPTENQALAVSISNPNLEGAIEFWRYSLWHSEYATL
jgi:hypothetical protein